DGQRNVDAASILVLRDGLEVIDPLAAVNLLEDRGRLVEAVDGDDDRDRPADSLFGRKTEKPLRASVPTEDHAIEILRHNRVFGRLDNRLVVVCHKTSDARRTPPARRRWLFRWPTHVPQGAPQSKANLTYSRDNGTGGFVMFFASPCPYD